MLQRIQTVFLLLVALCLLLTVFFPIWEGTRVGQDPKYTMTTLYLELDYGTDQTPDKQYTPYYWITVLLGVGIYLAIFEITRFKNRLLQIKIGALNSLIMAATLGLSAWLATDVIKATEIPGNYGVGLFLPGAAMVFNLLANRFIRRDEQLVRSVDRIR